VQEAVARLTDVCGEEEARLIRAANDVQSQGDAQADTQTCPRGHTLCTRSALIKRSFGEYCRANTWPGQELAGTSQGSEQLACDGAGGGSKRWRPSSKAAVSPLPASIPQRTLAS
jgi:hypothetical protein